MGVCCSSTDKQQNGHHHEDKISPRKKPPERINSANEFVPSVVNKNTRNIEEIY